MDIAISFDMTGSMTPCMHELRCKINQLMTTLEEKLADIRIAIITHGDYDSPSYLVQSMDFTCDINSAKTYIMNVKDATGNTFNDGEAYEEALKAANNLAWREHSIKTLIVIGDDIPHEVSSKINKNKVDWKVELESLNNKGVKTYGIQCPMLSVSRSKFFYQELSKNTLEGYIITMNQFSYIVDIIITLAFNSYGSEIVKKYEETMINDNRYNRNMEEIFNALLKRDDEKKTVRRSATTISRSSSSIDPTTLSLEPVDPYRFQILTVVDNIDIKNFVINSGATFRTGRGFYELTKKETISPKKEVIIQNVVSGDMFTGKDARVMLGVPETDTVNITPRNVPANHIAFIQSTSVNRKLIGNTKFLYDTTFV